MIVLAILQCELLGHIRALLKRDEALLRSLGATDDEVERMIELKAESYDEVKGRALADVSTWLRYQSHIRKPWPYGSQ